MTVWGSIGQLYETGLTSICAVALCAAEKLV